MSDDASEPRSTRGPDRKQRRYRTDAQHNYILELLGAVPRLKLSEVADRAGVSQSTVSRINSGECKLPSLEKAENKARRAKEKAAAKAAADAAQPTLAEATDAVSEQHKTTPPPRIEAQIEHGFAIAGTPEQKSELRAAVELLGETLLSIAKAAA